MGGTLSSIKYSLTTRRGILALTGAWAAQTALSAAARWVKCRPYGELKGA